jgi:hypothetical protein
VVARSVYRQVYISALRAANAAALGHEVIRHLEEGLDALARPLTVTPAPARAATAVKEGWL